MLSTADTTKFTACLRFEKNVIIAHTVSSSSVPASANPKQNYGGCAAVERPCGTPARAGEDFLDEMGNGLGKMRTFF